MPFPLSRQSIEAIAYIISGGDGSSASLGHYRTESQIERFMRDCNVHLTLRSETRVSSLVACLGRLNQGSEPEILSEIIEAATDPRDFVHEDEHYRNVLAFLNPYLDFDDFELRYHEKKTRLFPIDHSSPAVSALVSMAEAIGFDTVKQDIDRALASVETDPEDAITAACSTIESVCRSILVGLGKELPSRKDVMGLFQAVKEPLGLSSDRTDLNPQIAEDVRMILNGLTTVVQGATTVVQGVGALRTHGGDAHGRETGYDRTDVHLARLSIHAASTVSLFLIETWQRKFPDRVLPRHNEPD